MFHLLFARIQPTLPWRRSLRTDHIPKRLLHERYVPVPASYRERMTQNVQLSVQCAWPHALETLGAVCAHHPRGDIAKRHAGQRMPQKRTEREGLAVSSALARHHFVSVAAHYIGDRDAPKRLVGLRTALIGLEFLLTRPCEGK